MSLIVYKSGASVRGAVLSLAGLKIDCGGGYLVTETRGVACIQPGRLQRLLPDPGPVVVGDVVAMRRREQLNGLVRSWVEPAGAVSELPGDRVAGLTGRDVVLKGSLGVSGLFSLGDVLPKDGGAHEGTRGVKPDESVGAVGAGVVVAGYRKVAGELAVSGAGSGLGGGVRNGDAGAISPIEVLVAVSLARACTGAAGGGRGVGGVVSTPSVPPGVWTRGCHEKRARGGVADLHCVSKRGLGRGGTK